MRPLAVSLLLLCTACQQTGNRYNTFLQPCNRVDILVFNGGDTLFFDTRDSTGISLLSGQISGSMEQVRDTCPAQGLLRFRQDSTVLLEARFAVSRGQRAATCNYVAYHHDDATHVQALNDRAHKLLGTVMQQVQK